MKKIRLISALCVLLASCRPEVREEYPAEPIVPLYDILYEYADLGTAERAYIMDTDSALLADFMQVVSTDPMDDALLEWWSGSMPVQVFTPDVDSVFPTLEPLRANLGYILGCAEADSLGLPRREYAAVVYGRTESILFVDSAMFIALNHYLGEDYPGYSHWPTYMRRQKNPQRLPYDIAEALVATAYPYEASGAEATVLSRLVYEGVLVHAKMQLVPDADAGEALGYDRAEMNWLREHEAELWRDAVARRLLYDTSTTLAEKLVAPAPQVRELQPSAPGRAGRYIGYRIVEAYVKAHPEVSLRRMLSPDFYASPNILAESNYKL
ncbi:MAG: hypothetical protein HDS78_05345 [Bacteroidales bacterium]|nr:hypothetical protein [Bacteroidales bacterium]